MLLGLLLAPLWPGALPAAAAQPSAEWPDPAAVQVRWPDADAVFLSRTETLRLGWTASGEPDIRIRHHEAMVLLTPQARSLAERRIGYTSFSTIDSLVARTWLPGPGGWRAVEASDIRDAERSNAGVFYDDHREKRVLFPAAQPGVVLELGYTERVADPRFLGAFELASLLPVVEARYRVVADTGYAWTARLLGSDSAGVVRSDPAPGIRSWVLRDRDALGTEAGSPPLRESLPHVAVRIRSLAGRPLLEDVGGLYAWYRDLTRWTDTAGGAALRETAAALTEGALWERERARRIFHWVQDQVRYIAFEDGLGGFVPRHPALVAGRRYGDCKDMATLTVALMRYAGLDARLAWVGTRDLPYRYRDVPTPMADNHMVVALRLDGYWVFVDPTDDFLGFGLPSAFIQGKEALVGLGETHALVPVPVPPAEANRSVETAELRLRGTELHGTGEARFNGYPAADLRRELAQRREEGMARYLADRLELGNNKFRVEDWRLAGRDDRDTALVIRTQLALPDHARIVAGDAYVNLHLDRRGGGLRLDADRRVDRVFEHRWVHEHEVLFRVPEGYRVAWLPADAEASGGGLSFTVRYTREGDAVRMRRELRLDTLRVRPDDAPRFNAVLDALEAAYREVAVFEPQAP
jgi:transglutaminase-like putative cysteine protease